MNEVERFIGQFQTPESETLFIEKCNYWFAAILYRRFIRNGAKIMFNTKSERFATMINKKMYDISGEITVTPEWIAWLDFQESTIKSKVTKERIMF